MANLQEYKCPCCSGAIQFDTASQKMKCPYCDTEFEMETLVGYDEALKEDAPDQMNWDMLQASQWQEGEQSGLRSYQCKSCGGEIVGDDTLAASKCPYCENPIVMMGQFSGSLRPDYIIPFKLDKKAAKEGLVRHLSGKKLLPSVFKSQNHIDEIKGIYVPFWLFDTDADANIRYKATKIRTWSDSKFNYTETSFFMVNRVGSIGFDKVPVDASTKLEDDLMESLEPYDFNDAVSFQTAYLAGYMADKYDVSAEDSVARANTRVKTSTEESFKSTVTGYSTVTTEQSSISLKNGSAKYVLYPVWILNTTWNGTQYRFAMNGQNGKFVGNLPIDNGAVAKYMMTITAGVTVACIAISYLLWFLRII